MIGHEGRLMKSHEMLRGIKMMQGSTAIEAGSEKVWLFICLEVRKFIYFLDGTF